MIPKFKNGDVIIHHRDIYGFDPNLVIIKSDVKQGSKPKKCKYYYDVAKLDGSVAVGWFWINDINEKYYTNVKTNPFLFKQFAELLI